MGKLEELSGTQFNQRTMRDFAMPRLRDAVLAIDRPGKLPIYRPGGIGIVAKINSQQAAFTKSDTAGELLSSRRVA